MDYTEYDFIKQKYNGILEIYPQKAMNTITLEKVLYELRKTHNLVKVFDGWIRAFEMQLIFIHY